MATSPDDAVIKVQDLSRTFDVSKPWLNRVLERSPKAFLRAAQDISFSIGRGETFALVGESGSGKSTVAKMVVGLLEASRGEINVDGVNMREPHSKEAIRDLRRRMQMIFQDPYASLNPRWRVERIIAEPIRAFSLEHSEKAIKNRVGELLELVRLDPRDGNKFPHEFSGGQRQRICIARALASKPEFIVCDEPTSALDVSVQAQILNLMRDLQDEFGLTYLFISHDLAVVRHMAKRIGVMYLGRLVEIADSKELFRNPRHPYTQMLLDAIPDLEMSGKQRKSVEGEIPNPINPPKGCSFHPRCPYADEKCQRELPVLCDIEDGGEFAAQVACHAVMDGRV